MTELVQGCLATLEQRHWYGLHTSSWLTTYVRRKHEPGSTDVTPEKVIEILNRAGIRCVLMGTHALKTWRSEPRATQDVDILVRKSYHRKAISALSVTYPELKVNDTPAGARFIDRETGKGVLDVLKLTQTVSDVVFRHTLRIAKTHQIPDLEMTLASKYLAMVLPGRELSKKYVDAGDFLNVIDHNRDALDLPKLRRLANLVCPSSGRRIQRIVENFNAGRMVQLQEFLG